MNSLAPVAPVAGVPINTQEIANAVRYWVHNDNTIQELNKQIRQLRNARNEKEEAILTAFRQAGITSPVIQIVGGRILIGEDRRTDPLTFKNLEVYLHQYYRQKGGTGRDETDDIIRFIRSQRAVTSSPALKRVADGASGSGGSAPPPAITASSPANKAKEEATTMNRSTQLLPATNTRQLLPPSPK